MKEKKVLLATYPFGTTGKRPVELLERTSYTLVRNPYRRRLKSNDVAELLHDIDGVIAGTEPYNKKLTEYSFNWEHFDMRVTYCDNEQEKISRRCRVS